MPRKPNLLPRQCPLCKRKYGTVQFVIGSCGLIVRIGHYSPKFREAVIKINKTNLVRQETEKKRMIKSSERKWCNFHSSGLEYLGLFRVWKNHHSYEGKIITIKGRIRGKRGHRTRIPTTVKLTPQQKAALMQHIRIHGWGCEEAHSYHYKQRPLKNIIYYEKQLAK